MDTLKALHGDARTPEDRYLDITRMRPQKGEQPSSFFMRLWDAFIPQGGDFGRQLYHVFHTTAKESHPLLCMEVRTHHGVPGRASPSPHEVLQTIRESEGTSTTSQGFTAAGSHQTAASSNCQDTTTTSAGTVGLPSSFDYEKLADMVADRLESRQSQPHHQRDRSQPHHQRDRRPRGACWNCGAGDHHLADCSQPRDQKRIQAAKIKGRGNDQQPLRPGNRRL